jgi:8-oxo-dGTP diphosphatase
MTGLTKSNISTPLEHFFRGAFSVDLALFTFHEGKVKILLQVKDEEPFKNQLGLPGNLILPNEDTDVAIENLCLSLLNKSDFYKKQLRAFSELGRHPLGRVITITYYALISYERLPKELAENLSWHSIDAVPKLSYDHNNILKSVMRRFRKGLLRHPTAFELLPEEFIISDLIRIYEHVFGKKVDAPNFRKQIKRSELIKATGKFEASKNKIGKPSQLYTFDKASYLGHKKDRVQFNF